MKNNSSLMILLLMFFSFSCKDKDCIDINPMSVQCNIPPTRQIDSSRNMILGKWNWLQEGPAIDGNRTKTPCNQKIQKTAEFTADGKLYIYYNSQLAEKYRYKIRRQNEIVSNLPADTLGVIHLTDYISGNNIIDPFFPSIIFFDVCDKKLFLNYTVLYHTKGDEIWNRN
jgi:hypothetical protein